MGKTQLHRWFVVGILGSLACTVNRPTSERQGIISDGPECVGARTPGFWCQNQDGKNPNLTPDQVETIMERTTTDLGVPNYDTKFGWGLVNAQAALAATPAP